MAEKNCLCVDPNDCDWQFALNGGGYSKIGSGGVRLDIKGFSLQNIPQPLAQLLAQATTDLVNQMCIIVYAEFQRACEDPDVDPAAVAASIQQRLHVGLVPPQ